MSKIKQGEIVKVPEYEAKKYRVAYICIDCPTMYDEFTRIFEYSEMGIITSADDFVNTIEELKDDEEYTELYKLAKKIIEKELAKFGGDVWIYSRN